MRETRRRHRRFAVAATAWIACSLLSGCAGAPFGGCPEIGWLNTVTVQLSGDRAASVHRLSLCDENGCADSTDPQVQYLGDERWRFTLDMSLPQTLTLRVFDEADVLRDETEVSPAWERVGGTERCGGPHRAEVAVVF